jgi:hypothetical protein
VASRLVPGSRGARLAIVKPVQSAVVIKIFRPLIIQPLSAFVA